MTKVPRQDPSSRLRPGHATITGSQVSQTLPSISFFLFIPYVSHFPPSPPLSLPGT
ncbi:hypothetical protein PCANC_04163 [Puccinia coronata f. sp. avenae]|uniref:Uncharacterized protein n=1 Tax=Puccinia coronata f. sp. avenae TaxID=200324 RepID=A0A2N5W7D8_9BASI|nr:hypothetical protein PCANC_04163 [Puccinia coronata f. sp. avenae]